MLKRDSKGFTLIELLIVVAIIGIIAAIAIPNLLNAIDRGKQKRTMADMRSIGTAIESYAVDNNVYPVATTSATLATFVSPVYIKTMPALDGWNHTFAGDLGVDRLHGLLAGQGRHGHDLHGRHHHELQRRDLLHQRPVPAVPGGHPAVSAESIARFETARAHRVLAVFLLGAGLPCAP